MHEQSWNIVFFCVFFFFLYVFCKSFCFYIRNTQRWACFLWHQHVHLPNHTPLDKDTPHRTHNPKHKYKITNSTKRTKHGDGLSRFLRLNITKSRPRARISLATVIMHSLRILWHHYVPHIWLGWKCKMQSTLKSKNVWAEQHSRTILQLLEHKPHPHRLLTDQNILNLLSIFDRTSEHGIQTYCRCLGRHGSHNQQSCQYELHFLSGFQQARISWSQRCIPPKLDTG